MGAVADGLSDLQAAWGRRQLALYFAWSETLARYRRSTLGPLWLVFGTVVGVAGLGFVWSILLNMEKSEYIPQVTVGLVVWQLIAGSITESAGLFPRNASMITNIRLPAFLITMQAFSRQLINLGHNLIVVLLVFLIFPRHASPLMLLAIPGLAIVSVNLLALMQIIGILGARFRDLDPLISAFVPILFFLSPVIYHSRQLGTAELIMSFNPVAHYIRVIRDPLMGVLPDVSSYGWVAALTIITVTLALWITGSRGYRLPYWM